MQIYFHSCLCSYLPRVPILVEDTVCPRSTPFQMCCLIALMGRGVSKRESSLDSEGRGGGYKSELLQVNRRSQEETHKQTGWT